MQGKSDDWIKVNLGNQYGFVMDGYGSCGSSRFGDSGAGRRSVKYAINAGLKARCLGRKHALELLVFGDLLNAREALELRLAIKLSPMTNWMRPR